MEITPAYLSARKEAITWLKSERDFNQGLLVLQQSGYKPLIASKIAKWGDKPHSKEKLLYEIKNMIQVWGNPGSPRHEDEDQTTFNVIPDSDSENIVKKAEDLEKEYDDPLPKTIRFVIYEYSDAYKSRSQLHDDLKKLPEDNSDETTRMRKLICESIEALSLKLDFLYKVRKDYEDNGVVPEDDIYNAFSAPATKQEPEETEIILPDNKDELKNLRKNYATKLTRAKNMLLYSQEKKAEKENPLTDVAKKIKYEKRVAELTDHINRIDIKTASL